MLESLANAAGAVPIHCLQREKVAMIKEKLVRNIVIRLDRTQEPPAPHSIRPKEEERLRIFRSVIEILQLGEIPVAYAYSVPEQSSIFGYMRRESEQSELHDVPRDKAMSIDERIQQLVQELRVLTRPPASLRTDSRGYLQDGGLLLRYAPLIEWYEALETLGRYAGLDSNGDSTYLFPPVISLENEELRIPALPLEDFRDRINRIGKGQWPTEATEDSKGKTGSPTAESSGDPAENDSGVEGEGSNSQSGGDNDKRKTATIRLCKMIPVAQGRDGHYYHVPETVRKTALPAKLLVSQKIPRMGSVYDICEARIASITPELQFGNSEEDDGEDG
jgi:hypothetical protein